MAKNDVEYRKLINHSVELRKKENDEDETRTIGGYAVKYNTEAFIPDFWGGFYESFAQGAFDKSLLEKNQKCLWNHDVSMPLGSVKSGTLRFNDDTIGLNYDDDLPNNTWGNDAYESVKRGDVDGSSFGFIVKDSRWEVIEKDGKEYDKRIITEAELIEVSPCTFPAYDSSEINCRSHEHVINERKNKRSERERRLKLLLELEEI
jgi:HK97 family phage prohead protease|uniref:Head maturation protease n=1 Tax=Siphoviridae sp. ctGuJ10 TaxID=2825418 RepID=A0A8S5PT99_9CAUD|nr:MAG TPA: head maturation protease [Siphoviridae sp. ctGuJ10]